LRVGKVIAKKAVCSFFGPPLTLTLSLLTHLIAAGYKNSNLKSKFMSFHKISAYIIYILLSPFVTTHANSYWNHLLKPETYYSLPYPYSCPIWDVTQVHWFIVSFVTVDKTGSFIHYATRSYLGKQRRKTAYE